mgnify:CR=1 FL=1
MSRGHSIPQLASPAPMSPTARSLNSGLGTQPVSQDAVNPPHAARGVSRRGRVPSRSGILPLVNGCTDTLSNHGAVADGKAQGHDEHYYGGRL